MSLPDRLVEKTLALVDIENFVRGEVLDDLTVKRAMRDLKNIPVIRNATLIVKGVARGNLPCVQRGCGGIVVARAGKHGAERALMEEYPICRVVSMGFDGLVVVSGDRAFLPYVKAAKEYGIVTCLVYRRGSVSRALKREVAYAMAAP
jgi:hypothetical protein